MATILVVDDDRVNQRMLEFALTRQHHTVLTAPHGGVALSILAEESIDLVLADLSMPVVDGIELLRAIRADPEHATLPFIMLTGSGLPRDLALARRAGADDVLLKPTRLQEVCDLVERLLAREVAPSEEGEEG